MNDLSGLENISTLGRIFISNNEFLRTLEGLDGLTSVQNLPNIPEADGSIVISNNFRLEHFNELVGVQSIGGPLFIIGNSFIESLEGLHNIDPQSITRLEIGSNILLDSYRYANICAYLNEEIGPYIIGNNSSGCENGNVVKAACSTTSIQEIPPLSLQIAPNPTKDGHLELRLDDRIARGHLEVFNAQGQSVLQ
ncbi:MAG: hypothetical protein AAF985_21585 [Bacteroidota bacterium]